MSIRSIVTRTTQAAVLLATVILGLTLPSFAADMKETIDATAQGTSTQLGRNINVKVIIYGFSSDEDRESLKQAFLKGQSQGLVDALSKMKAVGRIQIPGTVGYDLAYIRMIPTPTGRKIRFAANRKIAFGEAARNTPSKAYDLTAGEFDLNDKDKKKSTGVLFPAAQLIVNKQGELQFELLQNPWKLNNIIDWNAKE